MTKRFGSIDT